MSVDEVEISPVVSEPAVPAPARRRRRPTRRAVIVGVVTLALLLAGGGYALWALVLSSGSSTPATTYRTVTVATETLKQTVSASGTIEPARQSALTFGAAGTVKSVKVEVGDTVAAGDTLATIDDAALEIARDSADAELDQAEQALADLQDATDTTDTQLAAAEATVKVKKSALAQAEDDLDDATLKAPFAGTIAAVGFAAGDTVGSSSTAGGQGGTTTGTSSSSTSSGITLISTGSYVVDTSVSVADVASVKKGLQAAITPTGASESVFGTVSSVGVVATAGSSTGTGTTTGSATFPVTIKVTGKQTTLLPGSSATVAITVKQLNDVISVPTQAVSSANGATVVQKLVNGSQVATPVTIGQTVGASTVITQGLAVGDQVVVASFTVRANQGTGTQQGQGGGTDGGPPGGFGQAGGQGAPPGGGAPGGTGGQGGTR